MTTPVIAHDLLARASDTIVQRGKQRDNEGERSMARCVKSFNAMYGTALTETQGWQFMVFLKLARAAGGKAFCEDDSLDGVAYLALAAESASIEG